MNRQQYEAIRKELKSDYQSWGYTPAATRLLSAKYNIDRAEIERIHDTFAPTFDGWINKERWQKFFTLRAKKSGIDKRWDATKQRWVTVVERFG